MSHRPLRRAMVAGAFAACLALTPGTAWAEEDPATPALPPEVTDVLEGGQTGGEQPAEEEEAAADETPEPPAFEFPPEVVAALQQFAAQAGFPEDCVTGVVASLEKIGNGIAGLPAELQELLTDLGTAVQDQLADPEGSALQDFLSGLVPAPPAEGSEEPPAPPTPPVGADITTGLQELAAALQACQPAPPTEAPPTQTPPQNPPASYNPPQQPAPLPQAPQPPVESAVYPGYAPTGAEQVDEGPSPVALGIALGIATAFLAGSGVWASRRWRAAHR